MNNEIIQEIVFAIAESNRPHMVSILMKYAGDEIESEQDILEIAKKTDEQLRFSLQDLVTYYLYKDED